MKQSVLVIGLGRFGTSAAQELARLGHEVLAIDIAEEPVNNVAATVTHAVQLDASDEAALRSAGAADFEHAIVALSSSAEASIFATMALKSLGVPNIIAKAGGAVHGKILEQIGASRVIFPEREVGMAVAHTFAIPHVIDYIDVAPGFGVVKVRPPASFTGHTLRELDLQARLSLTPIALQRGTNVTVNPHRDERIQEDDHLILIGLDDGLEQLADEAKAPRPAGRNLRRR